MAYTKVTSAHNGAKAINYLMSESHTEGVERNVLLSGMNMFPPDVASYTEQMQVYWNRASDRMKVQVRRVTQSFSINELDPENEFDRITAHEIGMETGKRIYGDRQFIVATQIDGKSGLIHNHIFGNNVDLLTLKGMRGDDYKHSRIRSISDEVVTSFGIQLDEGKSHTKYTQAERAKRDKGEYVWKDDLRDRIKTALETSTDYKSFEDALAFNGVSVRIGKTITYTLDDTSAYEDFYDEKPKKVFKSRGKKLGSDFDVKAVEDVFLQNQGKDVSIPEPVKQMQQEPKTIKEEKGENQKQEVEVAVEASVEEPDVIVTPKTEKESAPEQDEEPDVITKIEQEAEQYEFNLNAQVQMDLKEDADEEARRKEEEAYQYKMRVLQGMNIPECKVDGADIDDDYDAKY